MCSQQLLTLSFVPIPNIGREVHLQQVFTMIHSSIVYSTLGWIQLLVWMLPHPLEIGSIMKSTQTILLLHWERSINLSRPPRPSPTRFHGSSLGIWDYYTLTEHTIHPSSRHTLKRRVHSLVTISLLRTLSFSLDIGTEMQPCSLGCHPMVDS